MKFDRKNMYCDKNFVKFKETNFQPIIIKKSWYIEKNSLFKGNNKYN